MAGEWSPKSLTPPRVTRQAAQSDWIFYHGTPDERSWEHGAAYGIHVGTEDAAHQALNARIGRPLEGKWDGTREYGKTLLSPYQATGAERDLAEPRYPSGNAVYSTGHKVPMDARPNVFPVRITGPMIGHPAAPVTDDYANSRMHGQITRGNARRGYFYRNVGEDNGSISAAVPSAAHLERIHPPKEAHVTQGSRWVPSSGIFGPTTGLDQDLFDEHGGLRPDVRHCVMTRLDQCIRTDSGLAGSDWQDWTRVYLLGGAVSEWAGPRPNGSARDLDVIVAIDLHEAQGYGSFEGMNGGEAASALNKAFHLRFNDEHWEPSFGGTWSLTAFCNQRAQDGIEAIRPYAAYDLTDGRWAVRPPHLPGHSLADFDPAVIAHARAVAAQARAVLRMPEPLRTREARDLWEHVHAHRCTAFSAEGTGWDDPGNVDEKMLAYAPHNLLGRIRELALAPRTAARSVVFAYAPPVGSGTHSIVVHPPGAEPAKENRVGRLSWADEPEGGSRVVNLWVHPEYQRQGVATEMYRRAKEVSPELRHAPNPTDDGRKWISGMEAKTASWDSSGSDNHGVYLRFGGWPHDERSYSPAGGYHEEGVSAYDLDREGDPQIGWEGEHGNDPEDEMRGRVHRAESARANDRDDPHDVGHLVRGEMSGTGYDGEPLLKNVRRVGDWIDHRHLFLDQAGPHRLARDPSDEGYEEPEEKPPYGYRNRTAALEDEDPDRYVTCDQGHHHWGALGAAGLLVRHKGEDGQHRYLLQERSPHVQHGGTWSTPGGALQRGESPEEGALREASEEGMHLPRDLVHHHTFTDDHGNWAYHTVVMDSPRRFNPEREGESDWESEGHRWVTPQEARELPLHPGFAASWDKVRKSGAVQKSGGKNGSLPGDLVIEPGQTDSDLKGLHASADGEHVGHLYWWHEDRPARPEKARPARRKGEISSLWVHPDYQRRGVGTALFERARETEPALSHSSGDLSSDARKWVSGMERKSGAVEHAGESSDWTGSRTASREEQLAAMDPQSRAAAVAQEMVRGLHPLVTRPLEQKSGQSSPALTRWLAGAGHPGAEDAYVAAHQAPGNMQSNTGRGPDGEPVVALHPDRWDYGTLAHEAAHLVTDHQTGRQFGEPHGPDGAHDDQWAANYAGLLGRLSDGAGRDFLLMRRNHLAAEPGSLEPREAAAEGYTPPQMPPRQHAAHNAPDFMDYRRGILEAAKNPEPGTVVWRSERRPKGEGPRPASVGIHWTLNPDQVIHMPDTDTHHTVVYQGRVTDPGSQAFPRSHPMWSGQHRSMDSEAEVRLRPGTAVHVEGTWTPGVPSHTQVSEHHWEHRGPLVPMKPERMEPGHWHWHPVGADVPVAHHGQGIDYSDVGIHREAASSEGVPQRPKRPPGSAMVYLDVPHGTVEPHEGQEAGHHVALAYLPRKIGDEDFARVVDRAREAAARHAPMKATVSGAMTFPPGTPSDRRRASVVPVHAPGIHELQREFGEFDRAHYEAYTPHVTRAQLGGHQADPPPHPEASFPVTHVHVRRGDEVHSFPLTGPSRTEAARRKTASGVPFTVAPERSLPHDFLDAYDNGREDELPQSVRRIPISKIKWGHQSTLDPGILDEYEHGERQGDFLPEALQVGPHYHLNDGHHRVQADHNTGRKTIRATVFHEPEGGWDYEDEDRVQREAAAGGGPWYHGTAHDFPPGALIEPGHRRNYPVSEKTKVYFTEDLNEAQGHAYNAARKRFQNATFRDRIYEVEPVGDYEHDPDTGTQGSYSSQSPLRVVRRINADEAKRLRAQAVSGYDGLTDKSGMIYLDLPPGTVRPVPGGVDDHHVTICYLGKDVSDEAFEEACRRTREAAARLPPMDGVLRGIDIFPPSKSSDGKVVAFVPAYVGGIGRLRRELEGLSASEHKDYRPHATLAYLQEGDSLPAPHPAVPLRFTRVHVKRGDEVRSYPLGGMQREAATGPEFFHGSYHDLPPGTHLTPDGANEAGRKYLQSGEKHVFYTGDMGLARTYGPHVYRVQPLAPPAGRGRDTKRLHDPEPGFPREHEYVSSRGFRVLDKVDPGEAQAAWDDRTARRWKSRGGQETMQRIVDKEGPEGLPESARPHYKERTAAVDLVDVYHHTAPESARQIWEQKHFEPFDEYNRVYGTNLPPGVGGATGADYGNAAVHLRVPRSIVHQWPGRSGEAEHYYDIDADDIRPEHFARVLGSD